MLVFVGNETAWAERDVRILYFRYSKLPFSKGLLVMDKFQVGGVVAGR